MCCVCSDLPRTSAPPRRSTAPPTLCRPAVAQHPIGEPVHWCFFFAGLENFNFEGRGGTKVFNWHHFVSILAGEAIVHTVLEPSAPTYATSPRPPSSPRWGRCKQHFIPFHVRIGVTELGVTRSKEIRLDIWRSLHMYDRICFELSMFFGQPDRVRRWG